MPTYLCPVCHNSLAGEASLRCDKGHCFDRSKSGYVNLLDIKQKRSKLPGDNKQMAAARRDFLNGGFYEPLSDAVNAACKQLLVNHKAPAILDAGCGEGYYTERLFRFLEENGFSLELFGVDISKFALDIAAKRCKKAHFAVASAFHMPLPDASFDLILNLFAPYSGAEYIRLLKPEGYFLMAIPGENHLWELKQAVYPKPYKNKPKSPELEGFAFLSSQTIRYRLTLENGEDIQHLFAMTPYYYRTPEEGLKRLAALSHLEVQCEFELLLYRPAAQ